MTINVEFIQGSECSQTGKRITTLIIEYPRIIHSQLLTHRVFTKNSSSSRAVPIKRAIEQVRENPAKFLWTYNKPGMQGTPITDDVELSHINSMCDYARNVALSCALALGDKVENGGLNVHKQHAARLIEPYQNIRICLTSTEWENWDWLRVDADAQPEITKLANMMKEARDAGEYMVLNPDEWHVPFVNRERTPDGDIIYRVQDTQQIISAIEAKEISMSCAAQTSYRRLDESKEKADDMQSKLFSGQKIHASPSEHQATPVDMGLFRMTINQWDDKYEEFDWPDGISHINRKGIPCSGNFVGWIQNRHLIPNHDKALF